MKPFNPQEEFVILELIECYYQIDLWEVRKILVQAEIEKEVQNTVV